MKKIISDIRVLALILMIFSGALMFFTKSSLAMPADPSPSTVYVFEAEFDGGPVFGVDGFTDIQSAINAVAVGGTVNVASGTYEGNVTIDKQLTLMGDIGDGSVGAGTDAPTVSGLAEIDSSTITINASGVTVSGLIIQNNNSDYPGLIVAPEVSDVTINNNEITNALMGIILGATSYENLITENKIYGNGDGGIEIGGSASNVISNNDIYENVYSGIILNYMDDYSYWDSAYSASSSEVGANNIINNNIYQNGAYGINILTGIETESGLVNIKSNIIEENDDSGIFINSLVENISIENNTIKNNGLVSLSTGISVISALNNSAYNNVIIEDHNGIAIHNYDRDNDFDAAQNYWGSEFGPYESINNEEGNSDSTVEGGVNYKPWYTDEAMTTLKGAIISGTDPEYFLSTVYEVLGESFDLSIPAGTKVTGYAGWDGVINPPTVTTIAVADQPAGAGYRTEITVAYEVGAGSDTLLLDKAAKLVFAGQAGKRAGYIIAGGEFTEITTTCGANSQDWADANLGEEGECKIDEGADLVVWTKHFTTFATYTQTPRGGGGGGIVMASACTQVTYGEWGTCVGDMQYRNLLGKVPSGCTLTATQEAERSKACGATIVTPTTTPGNTTSTFSNVDVVGVMNRERALVTKINTILTNRLLGRILLQVEEQGQAWYLDLASQKRYFMGRPLDAFNLMRRFGIGITNGNLAKIPYGLEHLSGLDSDGDGLPDYFENTIGTDKSKIDTDGDSYSDYEEIKNNYDPLIPGSDKLPIDLNFVGQQQGKIFLQVQKSGEAWYVNPVNGKRYFLGRPTDAFALMRGLALGISNADIHQISVGD